MRKGILKLRKVIAVLCLVTVGFSTFTGAFNFISQAEAAYASPAHLLISRFGTAGNEPSCDSPTAVKNYNLYANDFVELYNPTNLPINFANHNYSIQYAASSSKSWSQTILNSGVIQPHGYYLVQEGRLATPPCLNPGQSSPLGASLPNADTIGTIDMAKDKGKIALLSSTNSLSSLNADLDTFASQVEDFVGYGTTVNGTPANQEYRGAPVLSSGLKIYNYVVRNAIDPTGGTAAITGTTPTGIVSTSVNGNGFNSANNLADFSVGANDDTKVDTTSMANPANVKNSASPAYPSTVFAYADSANNKVLMSTSTSVDSTHNTVYINLPIAIVKPTLLQSDVVVTNLPAGLVATAAADTANNRIGITVGSNALSAIASNVSFTAVIKSSAVMTGEAVDSASVQFTLQAAAPTGNVPKAIGSVTADNTVTMGSAANISSGDNTFSIQLTTGTINPALSVGDYVLTGLPNGLTATAAGITSSNIATFTIGGTASAPVTSDIGLSVVLKTTSVTPSAAADSDPITGITLKALQPLISAVQTNAWLARKFTLADSPFLGKDSSGNSYDLGGFSGLMHKQGDPINVYYTITDRGPNGDAPASSIPYAQKLFPLPKFTPQIVKIELKNGNVNVLQQIPLKLPNGFIDPITGTSLISGISNFIPNTGVTLPGNGILDEVPISGDTGLQMMTDPYGLDIESIGFNPVDNTFWIGEEYRPSIVQVALDGTLLQRLVPVGEAALFADAPAVPIREVLPAVFARREVNKGMEGLSITPDGHYMYAVDQTALLNNMSLSTTTASSMALRVLKFDLSSAHNSVAPIGEYVYVLDFNSKTKTYLISDLLAIDENTLLFDERDGNYAHKMIYKADLTNATNILGTFDGLDSIATPSLEHFTDSADSANVIANLTSHGITAMSKSLALNPLALGYPNSKLEGLAMPNGHTIAIANDNDFAVANPDKTEVWLYNLATPLFTDPTVTTVKSAAGQAAISISGGVSNAPAGVTLSLTLGESSMLGSATFVLPEGLTATTTDTYAVGSDSPKALTSSQIAGNGRYVTVDGITGASGLIVKIKLANRTLNGNTAVASVYMDSDGAEPGYSLSDGVSAAMTNAVSSKDNALISNITLSAGTFTFNAATSAYTVTLANPLAAIGLTVTTADAAANVAINGISAQSGTLKSVALIPGDNWITVTATAQDSITQTKYKINLLNPKAAFALTPNINTVGQNGNVVLTLAAKGVQNLYAYHTTIVYDPNLFTYFSSTMDSQYNIANSGANLTLDTNTPGQIRLVATYVGANNGVSGDIKLANLTFKAKMQNASTAFSVKAGSEFADANHQDFSSNESSAVQVQIGGKAVTGITLSSSAIRLLPTQQATLTATLTPNDAQNNTVLWSSDKQSVATVDANGVVKAVGYGIAHITATTEDGGLTAICTVQVADTFTPAASGFDKIVQTGENTTIAVSALNASNLVGFDYIFTYDAAKFDFISASLNSGFGTNSNAVFTHSESNGTVTLHGLLNDTSVGKSGNAALANITLKAKMTSAVSSFKILQASTFVTKAGVIYAPSADYQTEVDIADADVNQDGSIKINDLSMVAAAFNKSTGQIGYSANLDMDKNGIIEIDDLVFVIKQVLNQN